MNIMEDKDYADKAIEKAWAGEFRLDIMIVSGHIAAEILHNSETQAVAMGDTVAQAVSRVYRAYKTARAEPF